MELRAPAAGEHAFVPLDESGEVVKRLRRERLDSEVGHAWNLRRIWEARRDISQEASTVRRPELPDGARMAVDDASAEPSSSLSAASASRAVAALLPAALGALSFRNRRSLQLVQHA